MWKSSFVDEDHVPGVSPQLVFPHMLHVLDRVTILNGDYNVWQWIGLQTNLAIPTDKNYVTHYDSRFANKR